MTGILRNFGYCLALILIGLVPLGCTETEESDTSTNASTDPGQNNGNEQNNNNGQNNNGQNNNGQTNQGCGNIPDTGICEGAVVKYCQDGKPQSYDCAQEGKNCGETSAETHSFGCIDNPGGGGCGDLPDTGVCDGAVVKYCQDGNPQSYDCAQEGKICGETSAETHSFGCIDNPGGGGCGDLPDTGVCDGAVVKYCQDGNPQSYDCAKEGKICGETSAETHSFGCIDNPGGGGCGDVPGTGRCKGNVVEYCKDGKAESYDCAKESKICGVTSTETNSYGCITKDSPEPPAGDLKTAEDWARARIAGTVSTEDAFNAIAYNGGFPVITDDNSIIFMHWHNDGDWKVVGDFNNWDIKSTAMTKKDDIWYAEVPMPADIANKNYYKFYNVNEADESKKYSADPWALRYSYNQDGEISYIVNPNKPHLERYHNFKSPQGLKARSLRIYMPAGEGPFDVLYAHDGQNLYGDGAAGYGSWKIEENMEKASASFMIVGIDNMGEERLSEYAFADEDLTAANYGKITAQGDKYAKYVQETVRPFIESKYKTTQKAGLMGSSMGGLISLYIAHLYPDKYKVVLALSPTTAWGRFSNDNGKTIEDIYAEKGHRNFILYLDNGGHAPEGGKCPEKLGTLEASSDEFNRDCYCYTLSFVNKMASLGYSRDVDLFHLFIDGAEHNEAAWAARLVKPLEIFKNAK